MLDRSAFPLVRRIVDDELQIRCADARLRSKLKLAGFRARLRSRSGRREEGSFFVLFELSEPPFFSWTRPGRYTRDSELVRLAVWLCDQRVAFQDIPQSDASPSGFMRFLQESGDLDKAFLEFRYDLDSPRTIEPGSS